MFRCQINFINILICQNLALVGPVQQKNKLPLSNKILWKSVSWDIRQIPFQILSEFRRAD